MLAVLPALSGSMILSKSPTRPMYPIIKQGIRGKRKKPYIDWIFQTVSLNPEVVGFLVSTPGLGPAARSYISAGRLGNMLSQKCGSKVF